MTKLCIYHSADLDGKMSAAIFKTFNPEATLFGWNYGDAIPEITEDVTQVYFCDVSFPIPVMMKIAETKEVILYDHHKTVFEDPLFREFADMKDVYAGAATLVARTDGGLSGCELTYLNEIPGERVGFIARSDQIPPIVRMLGRYDIWDKTMLGGHWYGGTEDGFWNYRDDNNVVYRARYTWEDCVNFQLAMRGKEIPELMRILKEETENGGFKFIDKMIEVGKALNDYQENQNKSARRFAHVAVLNDMKVACINSAIRGSAIIEPFAIEHNCPLMAVYTQKPTSSGYVFEISFYSSDAEIDCGRLAKTFGGGGHKGAAGCTVTQLPWKLNPSLFPSASP